MEKIRASGYYRTLVSVMAAGLLLGSATEGANAIGENTDAVKLDAAAKVYDQLSTDDHTKQGYIHDLTKAESLRQAADRHRHLRDSETGWAVFVGVLGLTAMFVRHQALPSPQGTEELISA